MFKQKNIEEVRTRLDGVLQTLVEKKEDSAMTVKEEPMLVEESEEPRDALLSNSPKKGAGGKQSRKKKKGKEEIVQPEMGHYHHTYVMKLFDRSVDLAQFDEDSPLYPICRSWMKNQPHNRNLGSQEQTPECAMAEDEENMEDFVYFLPSPKTPDKIDVEKYHQETRIPSPVPKPLDTLDDYSLDEDADCPPIEDIFTNHMIRWKQTRQKWKNKCRQNEERYRDSMKILKDMFDNSQSKD